MAHMSAIFLLVLLQLSLHVRGDKNEPRIIQTGSSLSATTQPSSWASSSGHFQFGFYPQGNGFAVGIWIVGHRQDDLTVVWTANRDDPPLSPDATLDFTKRGDLIVRDGTYGRNISDSDMDDPAAADSASMLDSGNFVLYSNGSVIWESFEFPTDTILVGQNLTTDDTLISSVSSSNHSSGQYLLSMQNDGNLVAYVNNSAAVDSSEAYWASATSGLSYNGLNLNKEGRLILYGDDYPEKVLANSSLTGGRASVNVIYRATLDLDGIFRIYSHQFESNTSSGWTKKWQNLDNQCDVKGKCGLNSYCSGNGNHVECSCYPGFTSMDKKTDCSRSFTLDACEELEDQLMNYNVTSLKNMTWDGVSYSSKPLMEEDCKNACQQDCYCGGVLYSNGYCKKYSLPLRYGKRRENISTTAFIKILLGSKAFTPPAFPTPSSPSLPTFVNEGNQSLTLIMGVTLGSVACLCLIIAMSSFLVYRQRIRSHRKLLENKSPGLTEQFTLQSFSFSELNKATDGFKEELLLGKGSFGAVYKGVLIGSSRESNKTIAVKKLDKINEREREFGNEMTVIGRTNHRNLVRLLGFCVEGSKKLLVYEYMSNGSLANFLFNVNKERPIWKERARIALDVAKGILYLHEECEICIIHCNIKPQNILLDDFMTAKISDFGLAKLLRPNQTSVSGIRGTTRYSAPEWQRNASLSAKVDVYSFGVILLEIICCRSSIEVKVSSADEILLSTWVYNCFVAEELNKLVEGEQVDMKMLERFVKVGLWCIQDEPTLRPSMKNVTLMLEGTMDVAAPPSPSLSHGTTVN